MTNPWQIKTSFPALALALACGAATAMAAPVTGAPRSAAEGEIAQTASVVERMATVPSASLTSLGIGPATAGAGFDDLAGSWTPRAARPEDLADVDLLPLPHRQPAPSVLGGGPPVMGDAIPTEWSDAAEATGDAPEPSTTLVNWRGEVVPAGVAPYREDFESDATGDEWSLGGVASMAGYSSFAGPFRTSKHTLAIETDPGRAYTVEFDLYVVAGRLASPSASDTFLVSVDGATLLRDRFRVLTERHASGEPDDGLEGVLRRIRVAFIAEVPISEITFAAEAAGAIGGETWGIDNVVVDHSEPGEYVASLGSVRGGAEIGAGQGVRVASPDGGPATRRFSQPSRMRGGYPTQETPNTDTARTARFAAFRDSQRAFLRALADIRRQQEALADDGLVAGESNLIGQPRPEIALEAPPRPRRPNRLDDEGPDGGFDADDLDGIDQLDGPNLFSPPMASTIPAPGTTALLALGGAAALRRRRRA